MIHAVFCHAITQQTIVSDRIILNKFHNLHTPKPKKPGTARELARSLQQLVRAFRNWVSLVTGYTQQTRFRFKLLTLYPRFHGL